MSENLYFSHLLRDLNYLIETEKTNWATELKALFKEALSLKLTSLERKKAFEKGSSQTTPLELKLNELIAFPLLKEICPLTFTFQNQLIKHSNYLFTFLYNLEVPPDNNASERAVHNIKVKQKIGSLTIFTRLE